MIALIHTFMIVHYTHINDSSHPLRLHLPILCLLLDSLAYQICLISHARQMLIQYNFEHLKWLILILLCSQIFEWWYFKKYGTSFIEQVSLNHISPLLGGGDTSIDNGTITSSSGTSTSNGSSISNGSVENGNRTMGQQLSLPGESGIVCLGDGQDKLVQYNVCILHRESSAQIHL